MKYIKDKSSNTDKSDTKYLTVVCYSVHYRDKKHVKLQKYVNAIKTGKTHTKKTIT